DLRCDDRLRIGRNGRIRPAERDRGDRGTDIDARDHRAHAAHGACLASVDALDGAVREGAADERRVPLAGAGEIVQIAAAPAQETQILHALDRRPDVSVGALQFAYARWEIVFGHSVGCQLAHRPMKALNWLGPSPADAPAWAQLETRSPNV